MSSQDQLVSSLTNARELIKLGWIKSNWAINQNNQSVEPWSEDACKFCIEGAILGATHFQDDADSLAEACVILLEMANPEFTDMVSLYKINNDKGGTTKITKKSLIPLVNDASKTTHKQVIRMFTNAIKLAKAATWK